MQKLSVSKVIKEPGYVYIYISNEGSVQQDIYFDDLNITHEKSRVVQADHYYPFGLTFNSYQRENSVTNQYQYNGKEMQDELGLAWVDYGARMYMSDIGRWGVIDPLADKARSWTPYRYAFNNPLRFIDPDGMFEYSDGYSTQDSRNTTGAVSFSGVYENSSVRIDGVGGGGPSGSSGMELQQQNLTAKSMPTPNQNGTGNAKKSKDAQQGLPSPAELERRFGPSFVDFVNDLLLPELARWESITGMDDQQKVKAIMGFLLNQDFQSMLKDQDERHYLTFVEARIRLYDTNTRALVVPQEQYTEIETFPPRILRPSGSLVPGTVFNPGWKNTTISYPVNDTLTIGILIEFNYLHNQ